MIKGRPKRVRNFGPGKGPMMLTYVNDVNKSPENRPFSPYSGGLRPPFRGAAVNSFPAVPEERAFRSNIHRIGSETPRNLA